MWKPFLQSLFAGRSSSGRRCGRDLLRGRRGFRPSLEVLEERVTPSVTSFAVRAGGVGSKALEEGLAVASDAAGNVYVAGKTTGSLVLHALTHTIHLPGFSTAGFPTTDAFVAKYNGNGQLLWAQQLGGPGTDAATAIAVDNQGHVYLTGFFNGTAKQSSQMERDHFGPITFTAPTSYFGNGFVARFSAATGSVAWVTQARSSAGTGGYGIALDNAGNVYTTGSFGHQVQFEVDAKGHFGTIILSATNNAVTSYLLKQGPKGNLVWVQRFGTTDGTIVSDAASATCIAVDGTGTNIYVGGSFRGQKVDFSTSGNPSLPRNASGGSDLFVEKFNGSGHSVWADRAGSPTPPGKEGLAESANGVALDAQGNLYLAGNFDGTADFGSLNVTSAGGPEDAVVAKLDPLTGKFLWAKPLGGQSVDAATAIAVQGGHVFTTGYFSQTADLDPGTGVFFLKTAGDEDAFVSELDTNGNFQATTSQGGPGRDWGLGIAVDSSGHVDTTGYFTQTAQFGSLSLASAGATDLFVYRQVILSPPSRSPLAIEAERSLTTPTAWYVYTDVTASFLTTQIQQNNLRITTLDVNDTSGTPTFTATLVQNTGDYAKGWWWYYGQTAAQVGANLGANHARLIDLDGYTNSDGQERFAAVMVDNTGAAAKGWWWYYGVTPSFIASQLTANNARLIDLSFTDVGGKRVYNAVMASNTGSDATAWWYYYNQTPSQVSSLLNTNQARLIDIEAEDSGHFDVVMVQNTGSTGDRWWWYYGQSIGNVVSTALNNGARVVDLEPYSAGGQTVFAALMVDNVNTLTDTVGDVLRGSNSSATVGLYLKQVGGPVLADLQSNTQFEPASMIKVVLYLTALQEVQVGGASLTDPVSWYYQPGDNLDTPTMGNQDVNPDSFSDTSTNQITEPLGEVLDRMMKVSDNRAARAIDKLFGRPVINALAQLVGMTNTVFASTLGSGTPGNYLTLHDAGLLYEKVESGQLLSGQYLTDFRQLMTSESTQDTYNLAFGGGVFGAMVKVVQQEAARKLNKGLNDPAVVALTNAFVAQMKNNWKGGSYDLFDTDAGHAHIDRTVGGWVQLPFKTKGALTPRSYVYGIFINNALVTRNGSSDAGPELDAVNNAWANSQGELLRTQIRAALLTW